MILGVKSKEIQDQITTLLSSIAKEQGKISHLQKADEEKKGELQKRISSFTTQRGRAYFYNYLTTGRGSGPFTELVDGSIKYDLINSIGVNLLGHSHPLITEAHLSSATADVVMCGNLMPYEHARVLTEKLLGCVSKSRLKHFWFSCSGSFSNDTALKLIWQKKAPKYRLIAFEKAFAGRSVATQDITYNEEYREGMPKSIPVDHVPHFDQKDPANSLIKTLKALDDLYQKNGDVYCAIMLELIQGEGGFIYGTEEYYRGIFDWAKKKGLYIWVDEVQSFGRTHELFAFQAFHLDEYVDVLTVGKALQCCGTLYTEELNPKPGLIAGTFNASLVSLNAGAATLDYLTKGGFYGQNGKISQIEKKFKAKLKSLSEGSCKGKLGYYGGIGTMISFEVGDSSKDLTNKFLKNLFENGIIAFSAGKDPTRVRFLIPVIIEDHHIDEIFKVVEQTILQTVP